MIPEVDRNALWQAIKRFDNEYRNSSEWAGWEQNGNHLYAIKLGGKLYPVKFVVSLATGVPTSAFSGGKASGQANEYVREREFAVVEISEELTQHSTPAAPSPSSRYWIEKTHVRGRPDRESGEHALGKALWSPQKSADGRD